MRTTAITIIVALIVAVSLCGCMTQHQRDPSARITLPNVPKGSGYTVIIVGAQLSAKPVDLGGIISPSVDAAASQNGDVKQTKEPQK